MPNNRLWIKGLIIGIVVLFIGISIYPAFALKINTSANIKQLKGNGNILYVGGSGPGNYSDY